MADAIETPVETTETTASPESNGSTHNNGTAAAVTAAPPPKSKRGKKTAAAEKPPETPAAPAERKIYLELPPEQELEVHLDSLEFDRSNQLRTKLFDETTVERYKELMEESHKDGGPGIQKFPALRAIRVPEAEKGKDGKTLVVWDGFQRGESAKRADIPSKSKIVKIFVADGNRNLAVRMAAQANGDHGLHRTNDDIRKAITRIIDDASLLEEVAQAYKGLGREGGGGLNRGLATACNCSKGMIWKVLREKGLKTAGDKIVKMTAAEIAKRDAERGVTGDPAPGGSESGGESAAGGDAITRELANAAKETTEAVLRLVRDSATKLRLGLENLMTRGDIFPIIDKVFTETNQKVQFDEMTVTRDGQAVQEKKAYWPVTDYVSDALGKISTEFLHQRDKAAEAAKSAGATPATTEAAK